MFQVDTTLVDYPKQPLIEQYGQAIEISKDAVLKAKMRFPSVPIKVKITPFFNYEGKRAAYSGRTGVVDISVPYQWMIERKVRDQFIVIPNTPSRTLGAFFHEMGHAVLAENSRISRSKPLMEYFKVKNNFTDLTLKIIGIRKELRQKNDSEEKVNSATEALKKEWMLLSEEHRFLEQSDYGRAMEGLNELYADIFAVIVSQNPRVINDIFTENDKQSNEESEEVVRDFTSARNSIEQYEPDWDDVYTYFAPVKYHLFKKFFERKNFDAAILATVLKAIEELTSPLKKDSDLDLAQLNHRLIDLIDQQAPKP